MPDRQTETRARLAAAFAQLDDYLERWLAASGNPGLALAVTDRDGIVYERYLGLADAASGRPVEAATPFMIGSISKAFTAIALLGHWQAGRLDLHCPVSDHLPWFRVQPELGAITVHHLLTHTGGLVLGADAAPGGRWEVAALARGGSAWPPGKGYSYSNVGYHALGYVLEQLAGMPSQTAVQASVLDPLGMRDSSATIHAGLYSRMALGHVVLDDERPYRLGDPLRPAPWYLYDRADGALVCPMRDVARFARFLLRSGCTDDGTQLLSDEAFALLTARAVDVDNGSWYGYGVRTDLRDGRVEVGHGGAMVGSFATLLTDRADGLGVVTATNSDGADDAVAARHALDVVRAALAGHALPVPDDPALPRPVDNANDFAGGYEGDAGDFAISVQDGRLTLTPARAADATAAALEPDGNDRFTGPLPGDPPFALVFGRDASGAVDSAHIGERSSYRPGVEPSRPSAQTRRDAAVCTGWYRSFNPWLPAFAVIRRGAGLVISSNLRVDTYDAPLRRVGTRRYLVEHPGAVPDLIAFDTVVDGVALRATISGCAYYRESAAPWATSR